MAEDLANLSLMYAVVNDEEAKKRIAAMIESMRAAETAQAEARRLGEENQAAMRETQQARQEVEALRADLGQRELKLKEDTAALQGAIDAMNAEKVEFEKVRGAVAVQHQVSGEEIDRRSGAVGLREQNATLREDEIAAREAAIRPMEDRLQRAREHADRFVEALHETDHP
jgi:chromosome segregation ATPase